MPWLAEIWQRIPLKTMLAIILACLVIREEYPFSDFPMFGSFTGKTYYLYLADQDSQPIPALTYGVPTNGIKKIYDGRLRKLKKDLDKGEKITPEQDRAAAEETLRYLLAKRKISVPNLSVLQLVRVDVFVKNGELQKEIRVAGEVSLSLKP